MNSDDDINSFLDSHHSDDCVIDAISEGYPCVCRVGLIKQLIQSHLAEAERAARIDVWKNMYFGGMCTTDRLTCEQARSFEIAQLSQPTQHPASSVGDKE